ncbi:hypothetical protein ONE63_011387 [Megalurothrips usitatus]|uniref:Uncharacterized protein n=1 Tax=Megalurothrips usitatus TaxID=439358 RepID=A0AAV7X5R0_9NEOP|nr:hypothetical protein ONE63_011387 [Megalurothrips usitatus]
MNACVRGWPSLQAFTLRVMLRMDGSVSGLMPHLLVVSLILPLLSTVDVVSNGLQTDVFALLMAPLIFTVFVPICLAGESLAVAMDLLAVRAAAGPWLEESLGQRRLRLGLMHASLGRGANVKCRGIGLLDRLACGNALRSWFSFLQLLINVQGQAKPKGMVTTS